MQSGEELATNQKNNEPEVLESAVVASEPEKNRKTAMWMWLSTVAIILLGIVSLTIAGFRRGSAPTEQLAEIQQQKVDTSVLSAAATSFKVTNDTVVINGQLQAAQSIVIVPTSEPEEAIIGQIYLNEDDTNLYYYNGEDFVSISGAVTNTTNNITSVTNVTNVTNNSGTALPQPLGTTDSPTFAGLTLNNNLTTSSSSIVYANNLQQTTGGNDMTINAGNDQITFTANGLTFIFPTTGGSGQTICTTGISCAAGGGEAVILAPNNSGVAAAQTNASPTLPSIYINNTGGADLLRLQNNGTDSFVVSQSGELRLNSTVSTFNTNSASTNSNDLNLSSGNASGTTSNSGSVNIDSGTATGTTGSVNIGTANAQTINLGSSTAQVNSYGSLLVQGDNSTTAVLIQNQNSEELLSIDSVSNILSLNTLNSPQTLEWQATSSLTTARRQHVVVSANGFAYAVSGRVSAGSTTASVEYARLNADGTIPASGTGTWASTTVMPETRVNAGSAYFNGHIYVIGGSADGSVVEDTVYQARLKPDGTVGEWFSNEQKLATAILNPSTIAYRGYLYIIGGGTAYSSGEPITPTSTVQYASLAGDGSVGMVTISGNSLPDPDGGGADNGSRVGAAVTIANGYIYVIGGRNNSNSATSYVSYAKVNGDGSLGSWTTSGNQLPATRAYSSATVANGYIYVIGGGSSSTNSNSTVYYAPLNIDGSIGAFSTANESLNSAVSDQGTFTVNGYIYTVGGATNSTDGVSTVQFAGLPRTKIAGSLDLVGGVGGSLGDGGFGGSLTAGNTIIVGTLQVQESARFLSSLSVEGGIRAVGESVIRANTDTENTLLIQKADGQTLLRFDTFNDVIRPGITSRIETQTRSFNSFSKSPYTSPSAWVRTAVGGDGLPAVFYRDNTGGGSSSKAIFFKCNNSDCSSSSTPVNISNSEANGLNNVSASDAGMVVGEDGLPFMMYRNNFNSRLTFAKCVVADCSSGTIYSHSSISQTQSDPSVAIAASGYPIIAYRDASTPATHDIWIIRCPNSACSGVTGGDETEVFNTSESLGKELNIMVPPDNRPVIVHMHNAGTGRKIMVSKCADTACTTASSTTSISATNADDVNDVEADLGSDGYPIIAYSKPTGGGDGELAYVKCQNATCTSYSDPVFIEQGTGLGSAPKIDIRRGYDSLGLPIIFYRLDEVGLTTGTDLVVARCNNMLCTDTTKYYWQIGGAQNLVGMEAHNEASVFPIIVGGVSSTNIGVYRCVDHTCMLGSKDALLGGVNLGNDKTQFKSIFSETLFVKSSSSQLVFNEEGDFFVNTLSVAQEGNVGIFSSLTNAFQIQSSSTTNYVLTVDSLNERVGIGDSATTPAGVLHVSSSDTADLFKVTDSTATEIDVFTIEDGGAATFRNHTNSESAFSIQNSDGVGLITADTTNNILTLNQTNLVVTGINQQPAPVLSAGSNQGGSFSGVPGTTYYYKVTSIGPGGESVPSAEGSFNSDDFTPLTPPGALTAVDLFSGLLNGTYRYKVTFVTDNGETTGGTTSAPISVVNRTVSLSNIPLGPEGTTTQRKIYRTVAGGADGTQQLALIINDNITTTANDNVADGSLGAGLPGSNTATTDDNNISVSFTTTPGASYRVYRGTSSDGQDTYYTANSSPYIDSNSTGTADTPPVSGAGSGKVAIGRNTPTVELDVLGDVSFQSLTDSETAFQVQNANGTSILTVDTTNSRVGVGTTVAPTATLDVLGSGTTIAAVINNGVSTGDIAQFQDNGTNVLTVSDGGAVLAKNTVDSATAFRIQNAAGTTLLGVDTTSNGTVSVQAAADSGTINIGTAFSGTTVIGKSGGTSQLTVHGGSTFNGTLTVNGHIVTGNTIGTTTIAANTTNCGTGCTASISGNDTSGIITINTGTGAAAGTQATITFGLTFGSAPNVVITPETVPGSSSYPQVHYSATATTFDIKSYVALSDSVTYKFSYVVLK